MMKFRSIVLAWTALGVLAPSAIAQLQFDELLRKRYLPPNNDDTSAVALGDVDGDGDLDLVFGNGYPGQQNRLYLNDGTGAFTDATAARMPPNRDYTDCQTSRSGSTESTSQSAGRMVK